ncbi:MAG: MarR family transcriptional regulator [Pseudomonadota bacterium]
MAEDLSTDDMVVLLERLSRLVRAEEHASDLNPAQWEALRYLSRCNRFSNSPAALTRYLSATKGTISQTLIALERKGLVSKAPRPGQARSVVLALTDQGQVKLRDDPWQQVSAMIDAGGAKTRKRLANGSHKLVARIIKSRGLPSFGSCDTCRYFREGGAPDDVKGKHWCLLFEEPVTKSQARKICASHDTA